MSHDDARSLPRLARFIEQQAQFSAVTFGPGPRAGGIVQHIRREVQEIRRAMVDPVEWADVAILALDGAWRATPLSNVHTGSAGGCDLSSARHHAAVIEDGVLTRIMQCDSGRNVNQSLSAIDYVLVHVRVDAPDGSPPAADNLRRFERVAAIALVGGTRWCGLSYREFVGVMHSKLERNKRRAWPDWRTVDHNAAIERVVDAWEGV